MSLPLIITIEQSAHGQRLDKALADSLPERSRSEIQRWIREGRVRVGGEIAKASLKPAIGEPISIDIPETAQTPTLEPEALTLNIVYEDADLLVIDKQAGMVVHPAPGHAGGTLVNAVLYHCPDLAGVGGERRPGIVHRLDKDTSGLIVVAKHDQAHRHLQAQFKGRTIFKEYLALLEGKLQPPQGRITAPIGRHPIERKRMAVLPPNAAGEHAGREAITTYRVVGLYRGAVVGGSSSQTAFSLVSAILLTGRTHQIRVHFAWMHHPVVGDTVYGFSTPSLPLRRQFLHAHRLRLRLPSSGEEREFVAPLPPELEKILQYLNPVS